MRRSPATSIFILALASCGDVGPGSDDAGFGISAADGQDGDPGDADSDGTAGDMSDTDTDGELDEDTGEQTDGEDDTGEPDGATTSPETGIDPGDPHAYFEALAMHSNVHYSLPARSNDEILPLCWNDPSKYDLDELYYDEDVDAAANNFNMGDGSSQDPWGPGRDGRNEFDPISGTSAFFYWEARWSDRFVDKDENSRVGGELETHKAFVLLGTLVDDRALEMRSRFARATAAEGLARTDIRQYGNAAGVSPVGQTDGGDSVGMHRDDFVVQPNTWTYHWVFLDMAEGRLTYWIADENQSTAVIYDDIDVDVDPALEIVGFEFRHNSSQGGGTAPEGTIWDRNLAIVTGLTLSEAQGLVDLRG